MIVNTPYGIGILKKKKIQTLNNNYYIKNIDYTIINEENNTFPISQEIMKIIKPDIKIQIKNWDKIDCYEWCCNYSNQKEKNFKLKNIKITIKTHSIEFLYDENDLDIFMVYLSNYITFVTYQLNGDYSFYVNNIKTKWNFIKCFKKIIKTNNCKIVSQDNLLSYLHPFYVENKDLIVEE